MNPKPKETIVDQQQLRALELEMEQLERYKNSQNKATFWNDFEVATANQIGKLRRLSVTYHTFYTQN